MIPLRIIMEGDCAFEEDLKGRDDWQGGMLDAITFLDAGMSSGKPSIAVLVKCEDDGSLVIAQTSWALLHAAVRAFEARHGAPA